jgi:hypothetical protein
MKVTNIEISYLREFQPADYQKAIPAIKFSVVLEDGESHTKVARDLLTDAVTLAYDALGGTVPENIAERLAIGGIIHTPGVILNDGAPVDIKEPVVAVEIPETPTTVAPPADVPDTVTNAAGETFVKPAKRKRRTKVEMAEARAEEARVEQAIRDEQARVPSDEDYGPSGDADKAALYANGSEIPGSDPITEIAQTAEIPGASNGVASSAAAAQAGNSEIPGSDPTIPGSVPPVETPASPSTDVTSAAAAQVVELTAESIKAYATKLCMGKTKFNVQDFKDILAQEFQTIRTQDVPVERLGELKDLMDARAAG